MTNLVICDGYCDECEGFYDCPQKFEIQEKSKCWECERNPMPIELRESLWENLNPSWLCDTFGISVTNLLTALEFTTAWEEENSLFGKIEDHIQGCVGRDEQFMEIIGEKCNYDLAKKFSRLKTHMAKRILLVFHGQCPAHNCTQCWMIDGCMQH